MKRPFYRVFSLGMKKFTGLVTEVLSFIINDAILLLGPASVISLRLDTYVGL